MSKREPKLLLEDILISSERIIAYTRSLSFEEFVSDSKTIDAVVRNIEIIGEASNMLPDSIKDKTETVNWHKIRGLRNRIVHGYFGINYKIIWSVIEDYLPELITQIQEFLDDYTHQ